MRCDQALWQHTNVEPHIVHLTHANSHINITKLKHIQQEITCTLPANAVSLPSCCGTLTTIEAFETGPFELRSCDLLLCAEPLLSASKAVVFYRNHHKHILSIIDSNLNSRISCSSLPGIQLTIDIKWHTYGFRFSSKKWHGFPSASYSCNSQLICTTKQIVLHLKMHTQFCSLFI